MANQIIGFCGLAGAGKDTAARAMLGAMRRHGANAIIDSFALPIRAISHRVCLDPYDRAGKEVRRTFHPSSFCAALQTAIDAVLEAHLPEDERAALYAYTVAALTPFLWADWDGPRISVSPREFMQALGTGGGQRVRPTLWVDLATGCWRAFDGTVLVTDVRFVRELAVLDRLILVERPGLAPVNSHPSEKLAQQLSRSEWVGNYRCLPAVTLYNHPTQSKMEYRARHLGSRCARGKSW